LSKVSIHCPLESPPDSLMSPSSLRLEDSPQTRFFQSFYLFKANFLCQASLSRVPASPSTSLCPPPDPHFPDFSHAAPLSRTSFLRAQCFFLKSNGRIACCRPPLMPLLPPFSFYVIKVQSSGSPSMHMRDHALTWSMHEVLFHTDVASAFREGLSSLHIRVADSGLSSGNPFSTPSLLSPSHTHDD